MGEAFLHHGVAREVAALLFLEGDAGHVVQAQGPAVNEDEIHVGELLGGHLQGGALHEAGADNHLGPGLAGGLHGVVAVVVGGLVAVGGLIILIAQAVVGGIELHAVVGTLVEGLVLQLAHVGDEGDLILAVGGGHVVVNVVGIGVGAGGSGVAAAVSGGGGRVISAVRRSGGAGGRGAAVGPAAAAGAEGKGKNESQGQRKNLFHAFVPPFHFSSVAGQTAPHPGRIIASAPGKSKRQAFFSPRAAALYFPCIAAAVSRAISIIWVKEVRRASAERFS